MRGILKKGKEKQHSTKLSYTDASPIFVVVILFIINYFKKNAEIHF